MPLHVTSLPSRSVVLESWICCSDLASLVQDEQEGNEEISSKLRFFCAVGFEALLPSPSANLVTVRIALISGMSCALACEVLVARTMTS